MAYGGATDVGADVVSATAGAAEVKLDRNINGTGRGKYGLVNNRVLQEYAKRAAAAGRKFGDAKVEAMTVMNAIKLLEDAGILDWGKEGTVSEFFVVKLRDEYAGHTLHSYAGIAGLEDPELAAEVNALAKRAGPNSPFCKKPD